MKNYLKYLWRALLSSLSSLKSKSKHMIFCLLDVIQEQISPWYYLEFTITSKEDIEDKFFFPLLACMRSPECAMSLQQQIQNDLQRYFFVTCPEIKPLTKQEKNLKIQVINAQLKNHETTLLKMVVYKPREKKILPPEASLFRSDDLQNGNLRANVEYNQENLSFNIGIIKNQGVPLHQIGDMFTVKVDSGLIDPTTDVPEPTKSGGGDLERMKEIINKSKK